MKGNKMKIIQIAMTGHENTPFTQSEWTLIALYDDGSLWTRNNRNCNWEKLPLPLPEDKESWEF
jgi:hypothetical protein